MKGDDSQSAFSTTGKETGRKDGRKRRGTDSRDGCPWGRSKTMMKHNNKKYDTI